MRFFAVGQEAIGVIAIGQQATGIIAVGQLATGVIAVGQLARGVIVIGQWAVGLVALGQLYVSIGRATEAEPLLLLASRIDTHNADALTELGAVRVAQGQKEAALLLWTQALMYAPEHPRAKALMQQYSGQ